MLAVCAHPDDESFGLGAILSAFVDHEVEVSVLCLTKGEDSTLGNSVHNLGDARAAEFETAATALGLRRSDLLDYRDGGLDEVSLPEIASRIGRLAHEVEAEILVTFDLGGVTGHPDHHRATQATCWYGDLPVLAWTVTDRVATTLNAELATRFQGRSESEIDFNVTVDRTRQIDAIGCHVTQSLENPVLWRRLELQGNEEVLRWLRRPEAACRSISHLGFHSTHRRRIR